MAQVIRSIGAIQRKLLFPSDPGIGIIGEYLIDVLDQKTLDLNETREPWFIDRAGITVNANQDEYALDDLGVSAYGKARYLYTIDNSDPNHLRRPISIVPYEDLTQFFNSGDPATDVVSGVSNLKHSAQAAAVFYDNADGFNKLVIAPVPNMSADYVFVFEPSIIRPATKNDIAFRFEQFDAYISVCAALNLLPAAKWMGMTREDMRQQRNDLLPFLTAEKKDWDRLFNQFKYSMTNMQDYQAIPFGRDRW